jgi:uncharacterized membrane protein
MPRFKLSLAGLLLLILLLGLSGSALAQYFTINDYRADITVNKDGTIDVTETIKVAFDESRHGIFREIPFKYRTDLGKTYRTPIKVYSVKDDQGNEWKYQVHKEGSVVNIRIGDAKRYVDGLQTYVISYRVENALLYFDDHDELYWNVTGNYWQAPINQASAVVTLNGVAKIANPQTACYTGDYGSNEKDCTFEPFANGARFATSRNLRTGEGLSVVLGWEKGLVAAPTAWQKFLWDINLAENWVFVLPFISFIFLFMRWFRFGRDPKVRESVVAMYEPPKYDNKPLIAAEVGTLIDESFDLRDITASIIGLAVKGYIKIDEQKKEGLIFDKTDYTLIKIKDEDNDLGPFEKELLKALFIDGGSEIEVSKLKNKFYLRLPILKELAYDSLVKKKYFDISPEKTKTKYAMMGIFIMIVGVVLSFLISADAPVKNIIALALTGMPFILFASAMPAKTSEGALANIHIRGFQEFMTRADKDRLERMGPKEIFYKYLPYAIALGVVDQWSKAFEGMTLEPPQWYGGYHPGMGMMMFSPVHFSNSLTAATSSLGSAIFSAPRGSGSGGRGGGFGGGGFSGGGHGGGGGGSW